MKSLILALAIISGSMLFAADEAAPVAPAKTECKCDSGEKCTCEKGKCTCEKKDAKKCCGEAKAAKKCCGEKKADAAGAKCCSEKKAAKKCCGEKKATPAPAPAAE